MYSRVYYLLESNPDGEPACLRRREIRLLGGSWEGWGQTGSDDGYECRGEEYEMLYLIQSKEQVCHGTQIQGNIRHRQV